MTIIEACGDTVRRARHRDDQRGREYFFTPELVGAEVDRKSRGNGLDREEGALSDATEFRPLCA